MTFTRQTLLVAAVSCFVAAPGETQSIQGVIVSVSTHRPVGRARVSLVDERGEVVARYMTDSVSGAFYVTAPKRGTYELSILVGRGGLSFSPFYTLETNQTIDGAFATPDYAPAFLEAFLADDVTTVAAVARNNDSSLVRYPDEMLQTRRNGIVRTRFIVDRAGKPDMSTVQVVESDDSTFTRSVVDAIPRMHFAAAQRDGIAVSQVFDMDVDFCLKGVPLRLRGPNVVTVRAP